MSLKGQAMTDKVLRGKITSIHQIEDVNALYAEVEKAVDYANECGVLAVEQGKLALNMGAEAKTAATSANEAANRANEAANEAVNRADEAVDEVERVISELRALSQSYFGRISTIFLASSAWQGSKSPYSQVVSIDGVTANSKIDINPSIEQLDIFHEKDIAFVAENDDGVVTVYCVGQKPVADYEMQITITEVIANA